MKHFIALVVCCVISSVWCDCIQLQNEDDMKCQDMKQGEAVKAKDQQGRDMDRQDLNLVDFSGSMDSRTFSQMPNLRSLQISGKVDSFASDTLKNLPKLRFLQIKDAQFPKITREMMRSAQNLEILYIMNAPNTEIERDAFKDMDNLDILYLNNVAPIPRVTRQMMEGLENLKDLSMIDTDTTEIDENAFNRMRKLETLLLRDNDIREIKRNTFRDMRELNHLSLIGNDNLEDLDMDGMPENLEFMGLPAQIMDKMDPGKMKERMPRLRTIFLERDGKETEAVKRMMSEFEKNDIDVEVYNE